MANRKIRLTYLDLDGRAEVIRLVLKLAGQEFEDIRISWDEWPELKPKTPFGQIPIVEIDGQVFGQSIAIFTYFAREFGFYGKTNLDGLKIDQIIQLICDFYQECGKAFIEADEAKKAEITKNVKEVVAPRYLGYLEKLLEENGGKHFVTDNVTVADLVFFDLVTGFFKANVVDSIDRFPLLNALVKSVGNIDRIKAYRASRK